MKFETTESPRAKITWDIAETQGGYQIALKADGKFNGFVALNKWEKEDGLYIIDFATIDEKIRLRRSDFETLAMAIASCLEKEGRDKLYARPSNRAVHNVLNMFDAVPIDPEVESPAYIVTKDQLKSFTRPGTATEDGIIN